MLQSSERELVEYLLSGLPLLVEANLALTWIFQLVKFEIKVPSFTMIHSLNPCQTVYYSKIGTLDCNVP